MPTDRHTAISDPLDSDVLAINSIEDLDKVSLTRANLMVNNATDLINVTVHATDREIAA